LSSSFLPGWSSSDSRCSCTCATPKSTNAQRYCGGRSPFRGTVAFPARREPATVPILQVGATCLSLLPSAAQSWAFLRSPNWGCRYRPVFGRLSSSPGSRQAPFQVMAQGRAMDHRWKDPSAHGSRAGGPKEAPMSLAEWFSRNSSRVARRSLFVKRRS
jgi:hypothetical protein